MSLCLKFIIIDWFEMFWYFTIADSQHYTVGATQLARRRGKMRFLESL
jgi:hypothetical protein